MSGVERVQITDALWDEVLDALAAMAAHSPSHDLSLPTMSGYRRLAHLARITGEAADSLTDKDWPRHREALIQVAMSALAWVAALDHGKPDEWWLHFYNLTPQAPGMASPGASPAIPSSG